MIKEHLGQVYVCLMSELKQQSLEFSNEHYNQLLNKYLCLLVDTVLSKKSDFSIEFLFEVVDNIVYLHLGHDYPFIGKFDMQEPFNEKYVLDFLDNKNLILCGDFYDVTLTNLAQIQVLFLNPKINQSIKEHMVFFSEDLLAFGPDRTVGICIRFIGDICEVELNNSYPFIIRRCTFKFDVSKQFDQFSLVEQLDIFLNRHIQMYPESCFNLIESGRKFLESITILEKALFYTNELTEVYLKSHFLEVSRFSFFDINRKSTHLGLEIQSKIGIYISLNGQYIHFNFGKKNDLCEHFKWVRTSNMENDILMIRNFFIIYLEKLRGHSIKDLKREIQLIEMQTI
jgi:hypothetical protein